MTSIPDPLRRRIVGVDTHKYTHVAVALDQLGAVIGNIAVPAERAGYTQLEHWARELGERIDFGVDGRSSYGAGLVSQLRRRGQLVIAVKVAVGHDRRSWGTTALSDLPTAGGLARAAGPQLTIEERRNPGAKS